MHNNKYYNKYFGKYLSKIFYEENSFFKINSQKYFLKIHNYNS